MRKFIVVTDIYSRGGSDPLEMDLVLAIDENELARGLMEEPEERINEWLDADGRTPLQVLKEINGDGMNGYLIKELLPDGTLGKSLLED